MTERLSLPQSPRLQEANRLIAASLEAIEAEFARTQNDWLSCVGSRLFQLECLLTTTPAVRELGEIQSHQIEEKLLEAKEKLAQYKILYPSREVAIPDDIKEEVLELLQLF